MPLIKWPGQRKEALLKISLLIFTVLMFIIGTVRYINKIKRPPELLLRQGAVSGAAQPQRTVMVHVKGCVVSPGVYELKERSRVKDAIEAAGGFTPEADTYNINLAEFLEDGGEIIVLSKTDNEAGDGLININTATAAELERLPGIGPETAKNIVHYRETHGKFRKIEDIMKVTGIGRAKFERIKNSITIK